MKAFWAHLRLDCGSYTIRIHAVGMRSPYTLYSVGKNSEAGKQLSQILWRKTVGELMGEKVNGLVIKGSGNWAKLVSLGRLIHC